jgi:hypothetical protein
LQLALRRRSSPFFVAARLLPFADKVRQTLELLGKIVQSVVRAGPVEDASAIISSVHMFESNAGRRSSKPALAARDGATSGMVRSLPAAFSARPTARIYSLGAVWGKKYPGRNTRYPGYRWSFRAKGTAEPSRSARQARNGHGLTVRPADPPGCAIGAGCPNVASRSARGLSSQCTLASFGELTMISKVAMPTFSMGLAFCLALTFTPLGCGGTQEPGYRSTLPTPKGPTAPEATVTQLTDCTQQGASRLTDTHYAILFDVNVTEGSDVGMVKIRDSIIGDREIESCMVRALAAMPLPMSIMGMRSSQPVSPQSRGYMGNVFVAAAVNLLPILIVAAGVTIVVGVTVYVVSKVVTSTRDATDEERCKKVKDQCIEYCADTVLDRGIHEPQFSRCLRACMERNGC